jgi:hypothetical protein
MPNPSGDLFEREEEPKERPQADCLDFLADFGGESLEEPERTADRDALATLLSEALPELERIEQSLRRS